MATIPTAKKATLFDTIRETIQRSISNGDLKPGDRLPTEEQLTAKFNTSRPTINKAIRSLARDGFVETRKAVGQ
jgi:DNA-binding GntR family transcriptional regulator